MNTDYAMNIGMLWFDNDIKSDLPSKVERAASYYQNKYGKRPDVCFIHPSMAPAINEAVNKSPEVILTTGNVEVRTTRSVLPNHLWIGVHGKAAN